MKEFGKSNVLLTVDKAELKLRINERLQIGRKFITREIRNEREYNDCWDSFIDWDIYNEELIKQAFDEPNNSYASEYKRPVVVGGVYFSGDYK